jgi:3-dehydroquinate synthetase
MMSDKKAQSDTTVRLVLLQDIGRALVQPVSKKQLAALVEEEM